MTAAGKPVAWLFSDAKPGHENQALGLLEAVDTLVPLQIITIPALSIGELLPGFFGRPIPALADLPAPTIAVGAGHATHLSLLYAGRALAARTIVLMKPSLPIHWFDLCLVPRHDQVRPAPNVIETLGAINRVSSSQQKQPDSGVILIGGPSAHYDWDQESLLTQLQAIIQTEANETNSDKGLSWQLSASRRTPAETIEQLQSLTTTNLTYVDWQAAGREWLPDTLAQASYCWVTEDSVSMVYEALTAQARVGLLNVPRKSQGRVAAGIDNLCEEGYLVSFADWAESGWPQAQAFENQAERCARQVVERLGLSRELAK